MYLTVWCEFLFICFRQVRSGTRPNQLITFTRRLDEALAINQSDLPTAPLYQAALLQFPCSNSNRWSLNAEHCREYVLSDQQGIIVTAVPHHQHPTRQPFLKAVR